MYKMYFVKISPVGAELFHEETDDKAKSLFAILQTRLKLDSLLDVCSKFYNGLYTSR
jgi:hypothetical protein